MIGFIAAFIVLVLKKCCNQNYFALVIKFLFSLACGALIGDSFVHILAEAYHSDETESSIVSVIVICSIAAFVILEKLFESFGVSHSHWVEEKKEEDEKSKNQVGDEHSSNKLTQSKK